MSEAGSHDWLRFPIKRRPLLQTSYNPAHIFTAQCEEIGGVAFLTFDFNDKQMQHSLGRGRWRESASDGRGSLLAMEAGVC